MPAPAVYILAAFAFVGTAFIVKEVCTFRVLTMLKLTRSIKFVYDPHIAPFIEEYKEERRRRRQGPVAVPQQPRSSDTSDDESRHPSQRGRFRGDTNSESDSDSEHYGRPHPRPRTNRGVDIELEDLVAREVREWASPSARNIPNTHGLRLRRNQAQEARNALDEVSFTVITPESNLMGQCARTTNISLSPQYPLLAAVSLPSPRHLLPQHNL
jgi:hypothetical protein